MDITEQIGEYTIIAKGEVLTFGNNDICLTITDSSSLKMKIKFINDTNDEKNIIRRLVEGDTLTLTFNNPLKTGAEFGITDPLNIGSTNNNAIIYFTCYVRVLDATDKTILFHYCFLIKDEKGNE